MSQRRSCLLRAAAVAAIIAAAALVAHRHVASRHLHPSSSLPSPHRRLLGTLTCTIVSREYRPSLYEKEWVANVHTWGTNETNRSAYCQLLRPRLFDLRTGQAIVEQLMTPGGRREFGMEEFKFLSHFSYHLSCGGAELRQHVPIEPLIGSLRHPLFPCEGGKIRYSDGGNVYMLPKHLLDKSYLLLSSAFEFQWLHPPGARVFVFDLGASLYASGCGGASQQWFVETLEARGYRVDEYYAWEVFSHEKAAILDGVPEALLPGYHYVNGPAPTGLNDPANPLNILKKIAKADDYVLLKLDIDNAPVEMEFVKQLLDDTALSELVDEFFFEHHVDFGVMAVHWGNTTGGRLKDSYDIFSTLRRRGVRAHGWV